MRMPSREQWRSRSRMAPRASSIHTTTPASSMTDWFIRMRRATRMGRCCKAAAQAGSRVIMARPRPTQVQATNNETGKTTGTTFSYDGSVCGQIGHYNQVFDVRNLGYDGELLRSTRTCYQNSDSYTGHPTSN